MKNINERKSNILYKCKNCRKVVASAGLNHEKEKKQKKISIKDPDDILIFTNYPDSNFINFSVKKEKLNCKNCTHIVGYTLSKDNHFYGILSISSILIKELIYEASVRQNKTIKFYLLSKPNFDNLSRRVMKFLENMKRFCRHFYSQCFMNIIEIVSKTFKCLDELHNILYD